MVCTIFNLPIIYVKQICTIFPFLVLINKLVLKWKIVFVHLKLNEPEHDKTNKMTSVPSEDSDQPGSDKVFAVRMKPWVQGYLQSAKRRLWSDRAEAQADWIFCWAHRSFCLFFSCSGSNLIFLASIWQRSGRNFSKTKIQNQWNFERSEFFFPTWKNKSFRHPIITVL